MEKAIESIMTLVTNTIESKVPCTIKLGKATSTSEIVVDQKLTLTSDHLSFKRGAEFEKGDTVILLREEGGQSFIVMGVLE